MKSDTLSETDERAAERGYVMAMTALLLIPLMIFAAFAVDVGAWYAQAARTQRAADAAALAAVVWMPDQPLATAAALDVAAKNGFVHGVNSTITVERQGAQQVKVSIESDGTVYFGAVVMDSIVIERFAVAEYILPVPMGNPTNVLGAGNLPGIGDGIWLAVNGVCTNRQNGDQFSVRVYHGDEGWHNCDGGTSYSGTDNPKYDDEGYVYVVDVPDGVGEVRVQVYEPGICPDPDPNPNDVRYDAEWLGGEGPRLNMRLYAADNTPLSDQDNLDSPPVANVTFETSDCSAWYHVATIPGGNPGRWFLRVRSLNHEVSGNAGDMVGGINSFSLRATRGADTSLCDSLTAGPDVCPRIFAKEWLGLYRPAFPVIGDVATFYLAEIDAIHAGKTVEILMFDPGEGMNNLQIQSPNGTAMPFEYQKADCEVLLTNCGSTYPLATHNNCGVPCLDVTDSEYNDHAVRVLVDLPAGYNCDGETHCWWTVRYDATGGDRPPTDKTTWAVRVIGDPVRLTE